MRKPLRKKAAWQLTWVAMLAAGCAQSPYQHDPRAAGIGPDYLDYMAQYPKDRDTQYYYPSFRVDGMTNQPEPELGPPSGGPTNYTRLLTVLPPTAPSVKAIEGKGWPELEREGMPVFLPAQK